MFLRDEEAINYFAGTILLTLPWVGISWGTWGIILEILMLFSVCLFGRQKGIFLTTVLMLIGYAVPWITVGSAMFSQITFVPFAGLLVVYGQRRHWPVQVNFFWGAMAAGVLGALPALSALTQGLDSKTINDMVNFSIQQYDTSGLLTVIKQQGITEAQVRESMYQFINFYSLITPSLSAVAAIAEYGLVFYVMRCRIKDETRIPFTSWRLPWYAVWGGILGIGFYLLGDQFSWTVFKGLGINLMVVYGFLTFVLGISIYVYFLKSPRIPRILKITLIVVSFMYLLFSVVTIIMFGLFDLVFNFRRLPEKT